MKFFLADQCQDRDDRIDVTNPASGEVIDTVPSASAADVESAFEASVRGAEVMAALSGYERFQILRRAADLIIQCRQVMARTPCCEEGKTIREATSEVDRSVQTIELSGEEAIQFSTQPGLPQVGSCDRSRKPRHLAASQRYAVGRVAVDRRAVGSGITATGYFLHHGIRASYRQPDLQRPPRSQDQFHRKPRGGRTDLMPYGGWKDSGLGREGPKYAIEEMTEMKSIVFHSARRGAIRNIARSTFHR